jgi:predicted permease
MPRWVDIVRLRLRSLFRRERVEGELDKELRFHLEQQTEENIAAGMTPEEARHAALRSLGGAAQLEEECRDMRRVSWVDNLYADLRYALRSLGNNPGFTFVIVLTLALSIGPTSAIFSVIHGVLLRQLPYPQQDRLMRVFLSSAEYAKFPLNPWDFLDFRARNRSFESMAIMSRADLQLSGDGEPQRLTGFRVSAGYFRVLGIKPARGREFDFPDEVPGNDKIAILSDRLWRTRFHSDPNIIGAKIRLDGRPFTVVGVMTPAMQHPGNEYRPIPYGDSVDLWWPFAFQGDSSDRGSHYIEGIGRLRPGVSAEAAHTEMNAIMQQLAREHPYGDSGWRVLTIPLYREVVGSSQRMLLVLLGAVGFVLLIACANAANLLLARATARRREFAVRSALGAARSRLVQQMLTESGVIAVLGGTAGILLAVWGTKLLVAMLPAGFPRSNEIHVDQYVFAFTIVVTLATGFIFGLAPALQTARMDVQQNLRESGRSTTGSARHLRLRNWLVVSEVGLSCVLLIGAGLMLRSFVNLLRSDPGFRPEHVLTASVSLPEVTYKDAPTVIRFYDRLVESLQALPGVNSAGIGSDLPWTGYDDNIGGFLIEGKRPAPNEEFHARYHAATPDYFRAIGIPLLAGRFFTAADNKKEPSALIVNRAMANRYWPGEDPVGKRISFNEHPKEKDWIPVVGVVGDVKDAPQKAAAEPALWWSLPEALGYFPGMNIVVRANSDATALVNATRSTLHSIDPNLALGDVRLMDEIAVSSVSAPRFALFLVGLFALLSIALAAIGTYGVISYSVSQRTHEFGLRMALGARTWDISRMVLAQGLKLAAAGVVAGLVCSFALARVLGSLLYEVSPTDSLTFSLVGMAALAIAMLSAYVPARRATRADPALALRNDN